MTRSGSGATGTSALGDRGHGPGTKVLVELRRRRSIQACKRSPWSVLFKPAAPQPRGKVVLEPAPFGANRQAHLAGRRPFPMHQDLRKAEGIKHARPGPAPQGRATPRKATGPKTRSPRPPCRLCQAGVSRSAPSRARPEFLRPHSTVPSRALAVHALTSRAPGQTMRPPLLAAAQIRFDTGLATLAFDGTARFAP
jgi:hypothetical protein